MHSRGHGAALDVGRAYSRSKRARVRLGLRGCGVQSPRGARGSAPEAHSVPFAVRFLRCLVVCPVVSALAQGQAFASPSFALALVTERLSPQDLALPVGWSAGRRASGHFG